MLNLIYSKRNAHQLSGGEVQRTALARTLVLEADVYLLDEPTANVDKENIRAVEEVILSLNRDQEATVIVTTHSPEQAYRLSQNIIPVIDGKITDITYENVFSGTVKKEGDGTRSLALSREVRVMLSKGEDGPVSIAIDPQDIILSNEKLASSALNNFQGAINRLEQVNGSLRVYIDVGVTFCALITQRSYSSMGLNIGKKVWLTFKANSIKLL
jgi:tungstate transport system ATP-binding protein